MCVLLDGRQTNFISFSSQASITFGEMWEDKLSPSRTLTPNFFLKEGKTIEKKPLFKSYSIKLSSLSAEVSGSFRASYTPS